MLQIAHVIREVRQYQQTPYKIERNNKVVGYLLDHTKLLVDEDLYQRSLLLEPRASSLSGKQQFQTIRAISLIFRLATVPVHLSSFLIASLDPCHGNIYFLFLPKGSFGLGSSSLTSAAVSPTPSNDVTAAVASINTASKH